VPQQDDGFADFQQNSSKNMTTVNMGGGAGPATQ